MVVKASGFMNVLPIKFFPKKDLLNDGSDNPDHGGQGRRRWLGASVALAGTLLAPGVRLIDFGAHAREASRSGNGVRWGLLIDTRKCTVECKECVIACKEENGLPENPKATDSQWIRKVEVKETDTGKTASLPVMCQHCSEPPCVDVCPTGASFKRPDGIVLVDKHICIGCRYCVMACPYKARSFIHEPLSDQKPDVPRGKGTVEGCTFCVHKIDRGESPACVSACNSKGLKAMVFGDLNDPKSEISRRILSVGGSRLRADLKLRTAVRYEGI
jgi:tetrathionate reductase subunit B